MSKLRLSAILVTAIMFAVSGAAETYNGDGTYDVVEGDILMADNDWGVTVDSITPDENFEESDKGQVSLILTESDGSELYTTSITEGKEKELTNGVTSPKEVLRVNITDVDDNERQATISIEPADGGDEEEPGSAPGEDQPAYEKGTTFNGDGTYLMKPGDQVKTDRGQILELNEFQMWDRAEGRVDVKLYSEEGNMIPLHDYRNYTILSADNSHSRDNLLSRGIRAIPQRVNPENDTAEMLVTSNLKVRINKGWNLVSMPLGLQNGQCDNKCFGPESGTLVPGGETMGLGVVKNTCGDTESMNFWGFDAGNNEYEQHLPRAPYGYWVKSDEKCSITVEGSQVEVSGTKLGEGWNIIGGPTRSEGFNEVKGNCEIESGPWGYRTEGIRTGYYETSKLDRGNGYFVKVADSCTLGAEAPPSAPE